MKKLALHITCLCLCSAAHAEFGTLVGPFNLGSGNWNTIPYGGFNSNLDGWGGVGATSLMYIAHGTAPTDAGQLPYLPTTGVLRYGFTTSISQSFTFGGWLSSGIPQNVIGQRYVVSAFVNLKGRQLYHPAETHVIQVDKGNYNYVRTGAPIGGHNGWQFIYARYTATGFLGGSFQIMIVNEFRQALAGQEVEYDEIAVTPESQFALPTVQAGGNTTISGRVVMGNVVGPRPRTAYFELLQVPSGMRLATLQNLAADGSFSFKVGNYGNAQFRLRVKPDTGLWKDAEGQGILDGTSWAFPLLSCINGDIDGNNEVGPGDFAILANAFGTSLGENGFVTAADLDGNEEVGPSDFSILAQNFGEQGD